MNHESISFVDDEIFLQDTVHASSVSSQHLRLKNKHLVERFYVKPIPLNRYCCGWKIVVLHYRA